MVPPGNVVSVDDIYGLSRMESSLSNSYESILKQYKNIVVLTGAGISAESGINTFRDDDGLWEGHAVEEVATPEGFAANPELVQRFYNDRRSQLLNGVVQPNAGHIALAKAEEAGYSITIITQNVDDLHERAGSKNVMHMHGSLIQSRCTSCQSVVEVKADLHTQSRCQKCDAVGTLRPNIVWFGEMPFYMDEIYDAVLSADIFVAIGTSGQVYPAAGLVDIATQGGVPTLEVNLKPSEIASRFDQQCYGLATDVMPQLFAKGSE